MRAVTLALAAGVALLASGCASGVDLAAGDADQPLSPQDLQGSDVAAVQGRVFSDDFRPIEGAQVGITGGADTRTDAEGFYQLRDVTPGKHVLVAGRLGYESVARQIEVAAGDVLEVDLTLKPIEVPDEVRAETLRFAGFLECGFGTAVLVAPCTYPYRLVHGTAHNNGVNLTAYGAPPDLHPNKFWINFTVSPGIVELVAELSWTPGSAAAQQMNLFILCGDFDPTLNECQDRLRYGRTNGHSGPNPIRAPIDGKEFKTKGCPSTKYCLKNKPIWIANDIALPFVTPPQVAFQQKFEVWDTMFFNGPGPEGYTALPDK